MNYSLNNHSIFLALFVLDFLSPPVVDVQFYDASIVPVALRGHTIHRKEAQD